ncbi:MAG: DNA-binding transcriptional regulator [Phycisphaerae bacterium]|nr:DNA-binding transcriptional regulator [Phycisphaerae bacterium]
MKSIPKILLKIDTSRVSGRGILRGVGRYCQLYGQWYLTLESPNYRSVDYPGTDSEDWLADGMILESSKIPQQIIDMNIPVIGVDVRGTIDGVPNIIGDSEGVAAMAMEHFSQRGFKNFAYCGYADIGWSLRRGAAFARLVNESGGRFADFSIDFYRRVPLDIQLLAIADWLKTLPRPIAILACNDDLGRQIIDSAKRASLRVPDDVALLSVDNDEVICLSSSPPLSSVAVNFEQIGYETAELMDKMLRLEPYDKNARLILHASHIETRQSTDVLAVDDPEISHALAYIRLNARHGIQVADVARETALARRTLEYRFRKALDCSVNEYIKKVRGDYIARLLRETRLTMSQIADRTGFTDVEHIARFFRMVKGQTPRQYRQKFHS